MNTVERKLCRMHQRNYCHLVGNGTTALALTLQALGLHEARVGIPNSVCMNVALGVFFSKNKPIYLDINLDDLGLVPEELDIRSNSLDAVIAVHGYGSICKIVELENVAKKHGLPLIEDASLAQGGIAETRPIGSFGIASVLSFGTGKPINLEHGGAVLTNDLELYQNIKIIDASLPPRTLEANDAIDDLGRTHTQLYNAHYGSDLSAHIQPFRRKALGSHVHFLHRFNGAFCSKLENALEMLPHDIARRWSNFNRLSNELCASHGNHIQILFPPAGSVPWRLNLLTAGRDNVMRALHQQGLNASSWHPPVSQFFEQDDHVTYTPIAHDFGDRVLNLWISDPLRDEYLLAINRALNAIHGTSH